MDSVQPWVDAGEVRRLAEALMAVPTSVQGAANEAGYTQEFEGYAVEIPATSTPTSAVEPAAAAAVGVSTSPPALPQVAQASMVEAPYTPRLRQYVEWICSRGPVLGLFILHHESRVIFDSGDHARYHFMARSLAQAAQRQQQAHVQMKIGAADLLEVLCAETAIGPLVVGLIMNQSLTEGDVVMLCQSLQQVFVSAST
jgi:hypothetical protein